MARKQQSNAATPQRRQYTARAKCRFRLPTGSADHVVTGARSRVLIGAGATMPPRRRRLQERFSSGGHDGVDVRVGSYPPETDHPVRSL
jgi:hypothetical protein